MLVCCAVALFCCVVMFALVRIDVLCVCLHFCLLV